MFLSPPILINIFVFLIYFNDYFKLLIKLWIITIIVIIQQIKTYVIIIIIILIKIIILGVWSKVQKFNRISIFNYFKW